MQVFFAIVKKDLKLLFRDKAGLFFTLVFPLLMAVLFGSVFGGNGSVGTISVVLVDNDNSDTSHAFIAQLKAGSELELRLASPETANELVARGERAAIITLPSGFGVEKQGLTNGKTVRLQLGVDPSRRVEAAMLSGVLTNYLLLDTDGTPLDIWEPVHIETSEIVSSRKGPPNAFAISFPQGIVWGLMMCAMTFGMGLITERTQGTFMRLRVAPIGRAQILAGKAGACFVMLMTVQCALLALGTAVFGVKLGSIAVVLMAMVSASIGFVGIMMLLSVLGRTEKAANGYATSVMMVLMMFGGGMIPVIAMPSWMLSVSSLSPVKWAVIALEGSIWRDFSPSEMVLPCGILVGVGVVCFAIGASLFRDR